MTELEIYRDRLVKFANDLGYDVELDSAMEEHKEEFLRENTLKLKLGMITLSEFDEVMGEECRPSGDCNYKKYRIRVREGKGIKGQVSTLIHELCHALGLGGNNYFSWLGNSYTELAAESITEYVTQAIGIDRTKQTSGRVMRYGFGAYLDTPVSRTISDILINELKGSDD